MAFNLWWLVTSLLWLITPCYYSISVLGGPTEVSTPHLGWRSSNLFPLFLSFFLFALVVIVIAIIYSEIRVSCVGGRVQTQDSLLLTTTASSPIVSKLVHVFLWYSFATSIAVKITVWVVQFASRQRSQHKAWACCGVLFNLSKITFIDRGRNQFLPGNQLSLQAVALLPRPRT